jgi:hypothetical protein
MADLTNTTRQQIKAYTFELDESGKWVTLISRDGRYSRKVADLIEIIKSPDLEPWARKMYHEMLEYAQNQKETQS